MKLVKTIITTSLLFATTLLYAEITVLKIEGTAVFKDGNKWSALKTNQKLFEGVKISTGVNSYVSIQLNSKNHTIQIKPYSMVQIFSAETASTANTNIGLKRGSVNAKVPRDGNVKTVFKINTPVATSSVRGTEQIVSYGPERGMVIEVVNGEVEGKNNMGRTNFLTGNQKFKQPVSSSQPQNVLQDSRDKSVVPVAGHGLTIDETSPTVYVDEHIGLQTGEILPDQIQKDKVNIIDIEFQK